VAAGSSPCNVQRLTFSQVSVIRCGQSEIACLIGGNVHVKSIEIHEASANDDVPMWRIVPKI
jgi:hydroxyethylthiazole kinase-like sugar kinase family protein